MKNKTMKINELNIVGGGVNHFVKVTLSYSVFLRCWQS